MINKRLFIAFLAVIWLASPVSADLFTPLVDIITRPESFDGKFVTVKGEYFGWSKAPGYPPVTRSDWVIADEFDNSIYCTGKLPQTFAPASESSLGRPITVLAVVRCKDFQPYLEVQEIKTINFQVEEMVSVAQIIFDPIGSQNRKVSLMGVLAKGYGVKGERVYLIADPTGALKLGRLPKLYPRGTILHVRGTITSDENGLPMLDKVEIISVRVD